MPAEGLQDVPFDFATGMMAEAGCGDPVTLPLPVGTVVPPNPLCGSGFDSLEGVAEQGMQWLRGLLN